jgi:hypothetical protein
MAKLVKKRDIEFFLGVVFYLLAIAEELLKLGILSWVYSTISKTTVFYLLVIFGTAFIVIYLDQLIRRPKGMKVVAMKNRRGPAFAGLTHPYIGNDYGVKWHLFVPDLLDQQPWADGPYCPKRDRELEEKTKGRISKKEAWICPMCDGEYPKPKGDVKDMAEKNFAAYLRKKGKL